MRESRFSQDRRVIFRETFTPESIAKNGGVVTGGVSLNNGVATFDGTGYVTYPAFLHNGEWTFRIRFKSTQTDVLPFFDLQTAGYISAFSLNWAADQRPMFYLGGSNYRYFSAGAASYCDGEWHDLWVYIAGAGQTDINLTTLRIDTTTITPGTISNSGLQAQWNQFVIGRETGPAVKEFIGSMDLFEIYQGHLTDEEVSLLHNNQLYTGPIMENLVLFADYTKKTSLNWKNPAGIHTDTAVVYKHGLGAEFNGSTSKIDYGSPSIFNFGTGDLTIEAVIRSELLAYQSIICKSDGGIGFVWYIKNDGKQTLYFGDGVFTNGTSNSVITDNIFHHICISMDRSGNAVFYLDGISNGFVPISTKSGDITTVTDLFVSSYLGLQYINGLIKYIRIYKGKALTATEIRQNYQYARQRYGCL